MVTSLPRTTGVRCIDGNIRNDLRSVYERKVRDIRRLLRRLSPSHNRSRWRRCAWQLGCRWPLPPLSRKPRTQVFPSSPGGEQLPQPTGEPFSTSQIVVVTSSDPMFSWISDSRILPSRNFCLHLTDYASSTSEVSEAYLPGNILQEKQPLKGFCPKLRCEPLDTTCFLQLLDMCLCRCITR